MSPRASLVMSIRLGAREQDSSQLGLHLGIGQIGSPFLGHDDNVPGRKQLLVAAEKLPEEALHPVAPTGFAHLAPRHQPQPGAGSLPRSQGDAKMRGVKSFSPRLGPEVLPAAAEPLVSGKAGRMRGCVSVTGEMSLAGGLGGVRQRGSLSFTPRGACGPWPGGSATPGVRPSCSCGSKSRGCGTGAVCSVDTFVSWRFFLGGNFCHKLFINHFSTDLSRRRKLKLRKMGDLGNPSKPPDLSVRRALTLMAKGCRACQPELGKI